MACAGSSARRAENTDLAELPGVADAIRDSLKRATLDQQAHERKLAAARRSCRPSRKSSPGRWTWRAALAPTRSPPARRFDPCSSMAASRRSRRPTAATSDARTQLAPPRFAKTTMPRNLAGAGASGLEPGGSVSKIPCAGTMNVVHAVVEKRGPSVARLGTGSAGSKARHGSVGATASSRRSAPRPPVRPSGSRWSRAAGLIERGRGRPPRLAARPAPDHRHPPDSTPTSSWSMVGRP